MVFLRTLVIGGLGGFLFHLLNLPLPWLLGALSANILAVFCGVGGQVPKRVRQIIPIVVGTLVGTAFTPDVVAGIPNWIPTMIASVISLFVLTAVAQFFCRRIMGIDPVTALFSGLPGGLSEMTLMGEEAGADIRKLTLIHACRVTWILLLVPFLLAAAFAPTTTQAPTPSTLDISVYIDGITWSGRDGLLLVVCAVLGMTLARLARLPADRIIGPMILSAIVHLSGGIDTVAPPVVGLVMQLVVGSALGARFSGGTLDEIRKILGLATVMTLIMLGLSLLTAWLVAQWSNIPFPTLVLALSPGGMAEMALASLSMGLDTAFVTTHHTLRLIVIVFIAPFFIRHLTEKRPKKKDTT